MNLPIECTKIVLRRFNNSDPSVYTLLSTDMANYRNGSDSVDEYYENYPLRGTGWLAIVDKESKLIIGRAGLLSRSDIFNPPETEIAYVVNREYRGRGYAKEAAVALLTYAVSSYAIRRVFTGVSTDNFASLAISEKIGLKREYEVQWYGVQHVFFWHRKDRTTPVEQFNKA